MLYWKILHTYESSEEINKFLYVLRSPSCVNQICSWGIRQCLYDRYFFFFDKLYRLVTANSGVMYSGLLKVLSILWNPRSTHIIPMKMGRSIKIVSSLNGIIFHREKSLKHRGAALWNS